MQRQKLTLPDRMGKEVVEEGMEERKRGGGGREGETREHLYVCSFGTGPNQPRLLN